jgi:ketopantoate reductase
MRILVVGAGATGGYLGIRLAATGKDVSGAVAIVDAGSAKDVEEITNGLPLVQAGILAPPMIVPLKPYAGFGPRS